VAASCCSLPQDTAGPRRTPQLLAGSRSFPPVLRSFLPVLRSFPPVLRKFSQAAAGPRRMPQASAGLRSTSPWRGLTRWASAPAQKTRFCCFSSNFHTSKGTHSFPVVPRVVFQWYQHMQERISNGISFGPRLSPKENSWTYGNCAFLP
jgi:hypothetical protein